MTRPPNEHWVEIPEERIIFLPIPNDDWSDHPEDTDQGLHHAHLCYRSATDYDRHGPLAVNVFDDIYLFCAFIPPGSI